MNVSKEQTGPLNATVKLKVSPNDYKEKVDKVLKDYKRKMKMPGFRPGMVPFGMVKKMYGKAVMADEINKLLADSLYKYIEENSIQILGNPLPKDDDKQSIDFDHQKEFEFEYDLGLAPQFDAKISAKDKFTKYEIQADDKLIDKNINELAKRYGKVSEAETSSENNLLQGEFVEQGKEDGTKHASTIALEYIEDEKTKKSLVGRKIGDKIILNPRKVSKSDADMAAMLKIEKDAVETVGKNFEFTVSKVFKMEPAPVNQELFDKIFGEGKIKSEAEFRQKMTEELKKELDKEAEWKLKKDIIDSLIEKLKLSLPDEFLKRWLKAASSKEENKEPLNDGQIEKEYENYSKGLKWQLIMNKIMKENNINVASDELLNHTKSLLQKQFATYGMPLEDNEKLNEYAQRLLGNKEESQRIHDELVDQKVSSFFKSTFTIKNKAVAYDEFVKLATEKPKKFNLFKKLKF